MRPELRRTLAVAATIALAMWAWLGLAIDTGRIGRAGPALSRLADDAWPPAPLGGSFGEAVAAGLVDTLQIAVLATVMGALLSLPLAALAARNLMPFWIAAPARLLASGVRVLPSILWAIVMVLVFGFGPLAGVAAMTLYTVGYLAKLQYEAFEGLPRDAIDAVKAMGASRFQVIWHVVFPEAGNALRSQLLFMFEYNVRSSTIIGVVGAGGIGQLLSWHLSFFDYDKVLTIILVMFVTVVVIDAISLMVRRRYLEEEGPRAGWRDLFLVRQRP